MPGLMSDQKQKCWDNLTSGQKTTSSAQKINTMIQTISISHKMQSVS